MLKQLQFKMTFILMFYNFNNSFYLSLWLNWNFLRIFLVINVQIYTTFFKKLVIQRHFTKEIDLDAINQHRNLLPSNVFKHLKNLFKTISKNVLNFKLIRVIISSKKSWLAEDWKIKEYWELNPSIFCDFKTVILSDLKKRKSKSLNWGSYKMFS